MRALGGSEPDSPAGEVEAIAALLAEALERADALQLHLLAAKIDKSRHIAARIAGELPGSLTG